VILPFLAHLTTPGTSSVVSEAAVELGDAGAFPSPDSARATLDRLLATGRLVPRSRPELFVVEMVGDGCIVAGVLAVVSADHEVRPHERVLSDRVSSLTRHLDAVGAEAVPVTLAHRRHQAIADRVAAVTSGTPLLEARLGESAERVWVVDPDTELVDLLSGALYIVDGHHRVAAAAQRGTGFLALIVPAEQLRLAAFHRVVLDGAQDSGWLLRRLQQMGMRAAGRVEPAPGEVSVIVGGVWYTLALPSAAERSGTAARLDASRLHRLVLGPLLGAGEDCIAGRVEAVPATAGLEGLTAPGVMAGFALAPPSIEDVLAVADCGETLPAKTTYATPKPLAGLVVRLIGAR
jgi:uncharacterized protein (DUF1015 family)